MKRNPEPMRSFSYSGFNPNGQMSAFTGLAEYPMFGGSFGSPQQAGPYNYGPQPATQDSYGPPQAPQDSYGPPPSGVAGPQQTPSADSNNKQPQQYGGSSAAGSQQQPQEYAPPKSGVPVDSREQNNNSVEQADTKKQHRGKRVNLLFEVSTLAAHDVYDDNNWYYPENLVWFTERLAYFVSFKNEFVRNFDLLHFKMYRGI